MFHKLMIAPAKLQLFAFVQRNLRAEIECMVDHSERPMSHADVEIFITDTTQT